MSELSGLVAELDQLQHTYEPNADVQARMRQTTFVPVIGAYLTGKSTIMAEPARLDEDFCRVESFMTRDRRDGETEGEFLPHTEETMQQLLREANAQSLVQFTVHPTTGRVYGSRLDTWTRPFAMLHMMPTSFAGMKSLEFSGVRPVAIAAEPTAWLERAGARNHDEAEHRKRLREGVSSIQWCLENDLPWVINSGREPRDAARQLIAIAKGSASGDPNGPDVARDLLRLFQTLVQSAS